MLERITRASISVIAFCIFSLAASPQQMPVPETFLERAEFARNVADLLDTAAPWITDAASRRSGGSEIQTEKQQLLDALTWSGAKGALFWVRVEKLANVGVTRLIGKPILAGYGQKPVDILALYANKPKILPAHSDGFVEDSESSFYVWAESRLDEAGATREVVFAVIPPPLAGNLSERAVAEAADEALLQGLQDTQQKALIEGAIDHLKTISADSSSRARFEGLKAELLGSQQAMKQISDNLNRELEASKKASEFLSRLARLKNVLSIAMFVNEAASNLSDVNVPQTGGGVDLKGVDSPEVLEKRVRTWQSEVDGKVLKYRQEWSVERAKVITGINSLQSELKAQGAPPEVSQGLSSPAIKP